MKQTVVEVGRGTTLIRELYEILKQLPINK
jgi:hypothetical protein